MSKERARRRAERQVVQEKQKAVRARRVARRQRRSALVQRLTPRPGRNGRLYKRSRGQRYAIVLVPLVLIAAVWLLLPDPALRVVLTTVIVLAAPALVVVVLGRRA